MASNVRQQSRQPLAKRRQGDVFDLKDYGRIGRPYGSANVGSGRLTPTGDSMATFQASALLISSTEYDMYPAHLSVEARSENLQSAKQRTPHLSPSQYPITNFLRTNANNQDNLEPTRVQLGVSQCKEMSARSHRSAIVYLVRKLLPNIRLPYWDVTARWITHDFFL